MNEQTKTSAVVFNDLVSEGIRGNKEYGGFLEKFGGKSADDVAAAYRNLEKAYSGKMEGLARIPGEGAKPEEVAAFHRALGVPEKPDGYTIEPIEGMDDGRVQEFLTEAHQLGLTPKQVNALVQGEIAREAALKQADEERYRDVVKKYYKDDAAFSEASKKAERAILRLAEIDPTFAQDLRVFNGRDAHFTRAFEMLADLFNEGKTLTKGDMEKAAPGIDAEMADLEKKLNDPKITQEERRSYRNRMSNLIYQQLGAIKI